MAHAAGDAHPFCIYGAHFRLVFPLLDADGDLVTGATTPDSERSIDQGTFADCTNEMTEIATNSGMYYLDLTGAETTGKCIAVIAKSATAGMKTTPIVIYPKRLVILESGVAQAGANGTITLASGAVAIDGYYAGLYVHITDNDAAGSQYQARKIISYVGSTRVATIEANWGTNPGATSNYDILIPEHVSVHAFGATTVAPNTAGYPLVDAAKWNNLATVALPLIPTTAGRTLDVSATGEAGVDWANVGSPTTTVGLSGTTVKTATDVETDTADIQTRLPAALSSGNMKCDVLAISGDTVAADNLEAATDGNTYNVGGGAVVAASVTGAVGSVTGAVGSVTGAVASVTGAVGSVTGNVGGNVTGSVGSVATGGIAAASFAAGAIDATAIADGAIDAGAFAADAITAAKVAADVGTEIGTATWATAARTLTAATNITSTGGTTVPQTGDSYARIGAPAGASVSADVAAVKVDTAAILVDTGTTLDGRIPAALVGGRMDSSVGAMAANVMTAAAAAADLTTELQSGLATAAALDAVDNFLDTEIAAIKAVTDLLPDAGALTSLATAAALDTVDNLLDTEIPALTTAVGAIKTVTDALPNAGALTSLATQASVNTIDDFLDTEIAAIKAKTDNLPAAPASTTNITAGTITTVTNLTNPPSAQLAELTGDPGATPTLAQATMLTYQKVRNLETQTSTTATIANNAGTTILSSATSDNGTTFTKAKLA